MDIPFLRRSMSTQYNELVESSKKSTQTNKMRRLFVCAGEVSGDRILGQVLQALRAQTSSFSPTLEIQGIGGNVSQKEGLQSWWPLSFLAKNGVRDVLLSAPMLLWVLCCTFFRLEKWKPDLLLLVDYPGFNMFLLKWGLKNNVPVYYIAPPQLWAYKQTSRSYQKRQRVFRQAHVQVLFPMEAPHYKSVTPYVYQGHFFSQDFSDEKSKETKYLCLCPGSRWPSIRRNLSTWIELVEQSQHLLPKRVCPCFMVPEECHNKVQDWISRKSLDWSVFSDRDWKTVTSNTEAVVAFPGTVTLRWALLGKPVFVFGIVDSWTHGLAIKRIATPFLSLPNILWKNKIFQEWVGRKQEISLEVFQQHFSSLFKKPQRDMEKKRDQLMRTMGNNHGAALAVEQIGKLLWERNKT
jgi:lipid-A-disaccharide synthase